MQPIDAAHLNLNSLNTINENTNKIKGNLPNVCSSDNGLSIKKLASREANLGDAKIAGYR